MGDKLKTVFMGTPQLACASLTALLGMPELEVSAVVTQPDRPKGRQLQLQASPVKMLAQERGIPVLQPIKARAPDFHEQLAALCPDLLVVTAFGQILPESILKLPLHGCINVHTSLLPKYRGAAPIQWALINGDAETGVTIMQMDAGMDTGPVLARESTSILPADNSATLHDRLAELGASLLRRTIPGYVAGSILPQPQLAEGATMAPKIRKEQGKIDWSLAAEQIVNRFRGLSPWPGLYTTFGTPSRILKIWGLESCNLGGEPGMILESGKEGIVVACGNGSVTLQSVQLEGGRKLTVREFLAGHRLDPGVRLGAP